MKTSEMIAMLEKNPALKFRRVDWKHDDRYVYVDEERKSVRVMSNTPPKYMGELAIYLDSEEWELIPQPVPWQEALQAWAEGKSIKCVADNAVIYLGDSYYAVNSAFGRGISKNEIGNGTWYIEEPPIE